MIGSDTPSSFHTPSPFDPVPIPVPLRLRVTQGREFEGEDVVPVGQSHGFDVWDRLLQHGRHGDGNGSVRDLEAGEPQKNISPLLPCA
jgi:hypothetical protein